MKKKSSAKLKATFKPGTQAQEKEKKKYKKRNRKDRLKERLRPKSAIVPFGKSFLEEMRKAGVKVKQ